MAICRKPFITKSSDIAPCGRCPECLVNRKQLWTNRNILESYAHVKKCFITLTYSEDHLPYNSLGTPTLHKEDLQRYWKNLRALTHEKIRYYAVGEYGTAGDRGINPHYHALLYGLDQTDSRLITEAWKSTEGRGKSGSSLGFTYIDDLNDKTIAYVVGYVEKKSTYNDHMYEDLEIIPEFSTMSLKPTIGANAIPKLIKLFQENPDYLTEYGDVPYSIRHGSRSLPLGNYIREKIREGLDLPHDVKVYMNDETGLISERKIWHAKENYKDQKKLEMSALQNAPKSFDPKMPDDARVSQKFFHLYQHSQSALNFDAKQKLKRNNKTL